MSKKSNKNLSKARKDKNDEFYTQLTDIEKELARYKNHFRGKTVLCNCDDPKESNFVKYFSLNFEHLGLKKLIATHYKDSTLSPQPPHALVFNGNVFTQQLLGDGDFRSEECLNLLAEADIVVTNPPFSLFREYIDQLITHDKKFLVIGNMNAISYKEIFKLIKDNKVWLGYEFNKSLQFNIPDSYEKFSHLDAAGRKVAVVPAICWFTNLTHSKRNEKLEGFATYLGNEKAYPKYDNYDAIEVSKVVNLPIDYTGVMGVPITFLGKYNPQQFEIVNANDFRMSTKVPKKEHGLIKDKEAAINGKITYVRIVIKRK